MTSSTEDAAQRFRLIVQQYCDLVAPNLGLDKHEFLLGLLPVLAGLIHAAAELPQVEPQSEHPVSIDVPAEEESQVRSTISDKLGASDLYWENFDPTENEDPITGTGSLAGDLAEIYADVRGVLLAFDNGASAADVVWEWRLDFETHWGRHATDALRIIYHLTFT